MHSISMSVSLSEVIHYAKVISITNLGYLLQWINTLHIKYAMHNGNINLKIIFLEK